MHEKERKKSEIHSSNGDFTSITGAPNENIVQNHINIALLNVL